MGVKILLMDLETSGLHPVKNGIHQMAGRLFVDYICVKEFKVDCRLGENHEYSAEALAVSGKTIEQVMSAKFSQKNLYDALIKMITAVVDPKNKQDKCFVSGYNVQSFDSEFLRALWSTHNDKHYGSLFWANTLDVMCMASSDLMMQRHMMPNFKLETVAAHYGFEVDKSQLHDAMGDVNLTQKVLQKLLGIEFQ